MLIARVIAPSFKADDSVFLIRFEVENPDSVDYYLLKWFTPLEGLLSDCLEVTRNGDPVPYDGRILKRANPTANDYILIRAGQTVTADVDLHDAYHVSTPGDYVVHPTPPLLDFFPVEAELVSPDSSLGRRTLEKQVETQDATFSVADDAGALAKGTVRLTGGEAVRLEESTRQSMKRAAPSGPAFKAGALEPQFVGGDNTKRVQSRQAHFDGYALATAALATLANDAWYKEWFGAHTTARFAKVKDNFTLIKAWMETKTFTYNLTGAGCGSGTFAYTYKGTTTIWLCDAFWSAPASGTDSKAGTVVHEHGHCSANLDDNVYGQGNCRQLAVTNPDKAVLNADSHEYFARG